MVRKLIVILVFLSLNGGAFANADSVELDSITYPQRKSVPIDTLVKNFDNLVKVSQDCFVMVEKGMRSEGVVGYIRKHLDVFLPIIVFAVLYMVWLRRRARE
jgi:hypothetical protein